MGVCQNCGATNEEGDATCSKCGNPLGKTAADSLSALRQLAALDQAGSSTTRQDRPSQADDMAETIPGWLELLLTKYGQEVPALIGVQPHFDALAGPPPPSGTPTEGPPARLASLLEQMAIETEKGAAPDRLATSVDWGKPAAGETADEEEADWLGSSVPKWAPPEPAPEERPTGEAPDLTGRTEAPSEAPPVTPTEEVPDWLQELGLPPQLTEPAPPRPAAPEGEIPDWLRDLDVVAPGAKPPAGKGTPAVTGVTGWLSSLGEAEAGPEESPAGVRGEVSPPAGEPEAGESRESPDWLRDLGKVSPPTAPPVSTIPGERPPSTPPVEAEGEVPDWLTQLADFPAPKAEGEEPIEGPKPSPEVHAVPDWLREMDLTEATYPPQPPPSRMEAEAPTKPEPEIPDWLREMELAETTAPLELPSEPPPLEVAAEAPAEPEPEIPDWLTSLRSTESPMGAEYPTGDEGIRLPSAEGGAEGEPPLTEYPLPAQFPQREDLEKGEAAEEPDWLAELRATRGVDSLALGEEVVEAQEEALPDWLAELRASSPSAGIEPVAEYPQGAEVPPAEIEAEKAEKIEVPLAEEAEAPAVAEYPEAVGYAEGTEYPPGVQYAEAAEREEASALDWLKELETIEAVEQYPPAETLPPEAEAPLEPEEIVPEIQRGVPPAEEAGFELPEWLREGAEKATTPVEAIEGVAPSELPDWLRERKPQEAALAEPIESEGVLAGLPGLLPVVEELEMPAAPPARAALPEVPDVEGAAIFRDITAGKPEAAPVPEIRRSRVLETLVWALIFILLIAAIALVLRAVLASAGGLLGGTVFHEFFGSPLVIDPAAVNTFRAEVTKLPPDAVVVVSFDYSPATEAEMDPLAEVVVRDLLDHQTRVVAVSLRPEGAAMAQRLLDRFESEYPYGQRTLNLGYLPGQTIGVRSLAFLSTAPLFQGGEQTMSHYPAWQDVGGLDDVALIVDVADNPLAVRWWVEQLGPGTSANRHMVAAVSAAADPTVRPYYNSIDPKAGQLRGLISGITGAAAYENRRQQPGRAVGSLAAQSVVHLGLVVFSLGGTLVGWVNRTRET